ncbi:MAG: ammonia-forming cytochrome c nitrite reductase [Desulfotalea sp.]
MSGKYKVLLAGSVTAIVAMGFMANSIVGKENERKALNEPGHIIAEKDVTKNEEWARYYPREYDTWKKTKNSDEIKDLLKEKPQLAIMWAGYGFSKDYNAPRGHFYAVQDNINSLRTGAPTGPSDGPMPTACWTCKSPDVPRLMKEQGENEYFTGKWSKYGSEIVNPIGCADCHDSKTAQLAITRPYLTRALEADGVDLDSITFQDMRSLVCANCHVEYYFKPTKWTNDKGEEKVAKVVTLPWAKGTTAEQMEEYYNEYDFKDWTHKISKTKMLKAQHPGYEIYKTGIHAQNNVSCADCHMPYEQEGSVKYTNHQIGSPLDNIANTCLNCHKDSEEVFTDRVETKLARKEQLMEQAMDTLASAHLEAGKAWELGATQTEMAPVQELIRSGQWLWDYAIASHGSFFHAPEETLRLLSVANDKGGQARLKLAAILAQHGVIGYEVPDFSTKEKAQALAGVPLAKLVDAKKKFKSTLLKEWNEEAVKDGKLNMESRKGMTDFSSYSN